MFLVPVPQLDERDEDVRAEVHRQRKGLRPRAGHQNQVTPRTFVYLNGKYYYFLFNLLEKIVLNYCYVFSRIISDGLKYSLATGNWGDQKKAHQARPGVSQVLNRWDPTRQKITVKIHWNQFEYEVSELSPEEPYRKFLLRVRSGS